MNALRQALDSLLASGTDHPAALARFLGDLLNSDAQALVRVLPDGSIEPAGDAAMAALATAAAREGVAVIGRGAAMAFDAGTNPAGPVEVALYRLPDDSRLGQALARERLELVHALARSRAMATEPVERLLELAACEWRDADLHALATRLAESAAAPRLVIGALRASAVVAIGDSASGRLAAETRRQLELALGEAADDSRTVVEVGTGGFTGLDSVAAGAAVRAIARVSAQGNGLVALLWPPGNAPHIAAFLDTASPLAAARLERPGLSARFDRLARAAPFPAAIPADSRPRLARRLLLGLVVALALVPVPDRVRAPVSIEPRVKRVLTAPIGARIEQVLVEPGDRVAAGAVLVRLDASAIDREREEAAAQLQAASARAAAARADGDVQGERLAQLAIAQLSGRVAQLEERRAEAELRAPVAGTVNGDDLKRRTGATVARGELLLSIAAPEGHRAELLVGDSDVSRIAVGARVSIRLAARPLARIGGRVSRIYPLAEVVAGRNVFRTIAEIDSSDSPRLQAGMAGSGWIAAGWSPLAWQAVRPAIRWVRLRLWV